MLVAIALACEPVRLNPSIYRVKSSEGCGTNEMVFDGALSWPLSVFVGLTDFSPSGHFFVMQDMRRSLPYLERNTIHRTKRKEIAAMAAETLEARVERLEAEIEQIKEAKRPSERERWWEKIAGTFADSEDYEEAMRLGREWRQSQREPEDVNAPA